jgi:hypothetical protein
VSSATLTLGLLQGCPSTILRWDLVSISPRAFEILDPRTLPYSRPAVSHIGLTKWD